MKNQNVSVIANEFEVSLEEERFAYLARPHSEFLRVKRKLESEGAPVIKKASDVSLEECFAIGREYLGFNNDRVLDEYDRLHLLRIKHQIDAPKAYERNEIDVRFDILSSLVQPNLYMQGEM